jgi:DNA-binding GntR family transcriptional regulator
VSTLHNELVQRIIRSILDEAIEPGERLFEDRLASKLGVSRTPVRAALEFLVSHGFVTREKHRGFVLVKRPPLPAPTARPYKDEDAIIVQIASDRRIRNLPDQVSEQELMQAYGLTRGAVKKVLTRLGEVGIVERGLGVRYRFVDQVYDPQMKAESFRFRLMVEPACLLEPNATYPAEWIAEMRRQHQAFIGATWTPALGMAFFETNAAFHEGLAANAGNRFVADALHRINQTRRVVLYDWWHGRDRAELSCHEHMAILDAVEKRKLTLASRLMKAHLIEARLAPVRPKE